MIISIITAVYNNKDNILDALESVTSQTLPEIEHIIVDGGSDDGTLDILRHFVPAKAGQAKLSAGSTQNNRTIIVSEKDNGIYDAINKGIKMATGDIIGFLHSDDMFYDGSVIESLMEKFEQEDVDSVYGDLLYVSADDPGRILRYWNSDNHNKNRNGLYSKNEVDNKLKKGWMPPHPALFIKKNIYEKYGYYDISFKISSDYEMILRLFWKHKISTSYLPRVITKMRWGGTSNKNLTNLITKSKEDFVAMKKNGLPHPSLTLALKNIRKIPQFITNGRNQTF